MLGLEGMKIEKEKVGEVLKQSIFKSIKNFQKFLNFSNYYRQFVKNNSSEGLYMGMKQKAIGGITEYSQKSQYQLYCHISKLGSSCNLEKDLSKREDND